MADAGIVAKLLDSELTNKKSGKSAYLLKDKGISKSNQLTEEKHANQQLAFDVLQEQETVRTKELQIQKLLT